MNNFYAREYKKFLRHCYSELRRLERQFPLTYTDYLYYTGLEATIAFTKSCITEFTDGKTFSKMNHFLVIEYKNFLKHCYNEFRLLEMKFPLTYDGYIYYNTLIKTIRFTKRTMTVCTVGYEIFFERKSNLKLYHKYFTSQMKHHKQVLKNWDFIPNKEWDPYYNQTLSYYIHTKETVKEIENLLSKIIY